MEVEDNPGMDDSPDTMKILVATDIHLGYLEQDPVRGNDSVTAFEEILQLAKQHGVDFILLGGDLFHDNKPSRKSLHDAIVLLRKYCMGDKPVQFMFLSDQSVNFGHTPFSCVNYEDPNFNISIPVFSIHGNHDDPAGLGTLCSLDLLSAAGLINYFGKFTSLEKIEISPLLMQKGKTKLALYGLGAIRDERLHRLFVNKNVSMLRPRENKDEWFNVFVIHQNRSKHGETSYIPEHFLDDFLDLVIWGHEHECRINPTNNGRNKFLISQPGSSIATSLSEGETKEKFVGLLLVCGTQWKMKPLKLETVRQFKMEDIVLAKTSLNPDDPEVAKKAQDFCLEKVEFLLEQAAIERADDRHRPDKPLIRIRVDYSDGFEPFSKHRFGQRFVDRVANPKDMIHFHQRRSITYGGQSAENFGSGTGQFKMTELPLSSASVEDMVKSLFSKADKDFQLCLLTEEGLGEAIRVFVDKDEKMAISELVKHQIQKTQDYLKKRNIPEDVIEGEILRFREQRKHKPEEEEKDIKDVLTRVHSLVMSQSTYDDDADDDVMMDVGSDSSIAKPRKSQKGSGVRGRQRGRCVAGRNSRGMNKPASQKPQCSMSIKEAFAASTKKQRDEEFIEMEDSDEDNFNSFSNQSGQRRARSSVTSRHGGRKGVQFDSGSDDDDNGPYQTKRSKR